MKEQIYRCIKRNIPEVFKQVIHKIRYRLKSAVVRNVNGTNYNKNCLLVYITAPFLYGAKDIHQSQLQVLEIARVIGGLGYNVDVVDWCNSYSKKHLGKKYDMIFDMFPQVGDIPDKFLTKACKRIGYIGGSEENFSNAAEKKRLEMLWRRRGVHLRPRRQCVPADYFLCDAVLFLGNQHNLQTFRFARLPQVYFINNTGYKLDINLYSENKRTNNFLFLASMGQVHKGLDLLLEAFAYYAKNCNLYVCSPFVDERDFNQCYKKELYCTENIFPVGFIDIHSIKFKNIAEKCSYMIMPSCSEGNTGSVLTAMSAGLIPIVSRECGFEDDEVIYLENCSIDCIVENVQKYAKKEMDWIINESERLQFIVGNRYSIERFSETLDCTLRSILG